MFNKLAITETNTFYGGLPLGIRERQIIVDSL